MTKTVIHTVAPNSASQSRERRATNLSVRKRSIVRHGHKSSVSLEDQFWDALREIAAHKKMTVSRLVETIDHGSNRDNLSSAIRVFVVDYFMHNHQPPISQ